MKTVLIVLLGINIHVFCNGQDMPDYMSQLIHLKSRGIDTCIVFYECDIDPREYVVTDTCIFQNPRYLLWKEKNQIFILKSVECMDTTWARTIKMQSKPLITPNKQAYSLIENKLTEIIEEEIYPAIIKI